MKLATTIISPRIGLMTLICCVLATGGVTACKKREADPEFKQAVQARFDEMQRDQAIVESAPWFGKTGLSAEDERELPRYIRREFGQLLVDKDSIKAADLEYLGVFTEGVETVHFWKIKTTSEEPAYAYYVAAPDDRIVMGWGDRKPPQ